MLGDWWKAHALEYVIAAVIVGLVAVLSFFGAITKAWRERKQKKRDGLL